MEQSLIEQLMKLEIITEPDELTTHIERIVQGLGFDYFRMAIIIPVSHHRPEVSILNSCPEEWIESYSRRGMLARDPVVAAARRQLTPIWWDKVRGTDEQMDVMIEAAKCGLRHGVSYPLHGPRGEHGVLSFITERERPGFYLEITPTLGMVVPSVLEAAIRICRPKGDAGLKVIEADCLFWVSAGKTTGEISIILGMPERTVTHHLNSATRKLGANNRYNAVARAMAGGELSWTLDRVTVIDY
ncbi:transcriptional regulator [Aeromonas caviae]|uniref:Transcriptional regulator n=1 Tax=Aeromonas caviae TaxID=648 RepID=A0AA37FVT2_AERCA|nr:LuxR family transcriptional regulator [Aeromonas caviae]GJA64132.1 transcriptional regulator [Aeromonas caviae]